MLSLAMLSRALRKLHSYRARDPVPEELRGWSWHQPPLKPRAFLGLGVSEVAYRFCPTRRDLWLRRVEGVQPEPNGAMKRGSALHTVFHLTAKEVARAVVLGNTPWDAYERAASRCRKIVVEALGSFDPWLCSVCKEMAFGWASLANELGHPPALTEVLVDGSLLGLSKNLRVDAIMDGSVVVELKYGSLRNDYVAALAGYAMALESFLEIPIDFGLIILVNGWERRRIRVEAVYLGAEARQSFIEARDEAIDILLSGSPPPPAPSCPPSCPFKPYCRGGSG